MVPIMRRTIRPIVSAVGVVILAMLVVPAAPVGATDQYSSYYTVDDYYGHDYQVRAMVRHTSYSDHIYAESFWLYIDVLGTSQQAVCENYNWLRITPSPSTGTVWSDASPFPLYYSNSPAWAYETFYQNMYWSSSQPVRILHETASVNVCGSGSQWMAAGVAMYRFPTYWHDQGT